MSGILGIWNTAGGAVREETLAPMAAALAHLGPDGCQTVVTGPAALAVQTMRVTPESAEEKQPYAAEGGVIALFDGRLDNREELVAALPGAAVLSRAPDIELIAAAHRAWAEGALARLQGDFALAIFDSRARRLLLARDAMGARPLYFVRAGDLVLFASEIKGLLAHPAVICRPNEKALAEFVFANLDPEDESATFFAGVQRVPPGSIVRITPERSVTNRYFEFDTTRFLRLRDHREYLDAYREGFARAVRRRLRSAAPTGLLVSGGLDSSAICCMAYELTRREPGRHAKLLPLGLVADDSTPGGADASEWEFQHAVEQHCGAKILRSPLRSFAAGEEAERKVWHAEGPWMLENAYAHLYGEARQQGVRVVLSGIFGDNLLMSPQFLADLLLQGRWIAAWKAYRAMVKKPWYVFVPTPDNTAALRRYLARELRPYLLPEPLLRGLRRLRSSASSNNADYYSAAFAAFGNERYCPRQTTGRAHARALYRAAQSQMLALRVEMDAKAAAMFGVQISYPYRDRELVQLVMSMPGEEVYADGDSRGLHREAMSGILPEAIRLRRTKADFTEFARAGLLEDLGALPRPLRGAAAAHGWLHPDLEQRFDFLVQTLRSEPRLTKELNDTVGNLLNIEVMTKVFFKKRSVGDRIAANNLPSRVKHS